MNAWQWISVIGLSAFKVIPATGLAVAYQGNPLEIFLTLTIGGIAGVVFFSFFGTRIRDWRRKRRRERDNSNKKPPNLERARRLLRFWKKYGLIGAAILTPPIISPPIGTLIAVMFGESHIRILIYMSVSMAVWGAIFALMGNQILQWI